MDKYAQLINDLQKKLDDLLKEKSKIEKEIWDLEVKERSLKNNIYVDGNYIEYNKIGLNDIDKAEERYPKYMKTSLSIIFILSLIINIFLNNLSAIPYLSTIINSLVSSSLFTLVVGVAEKCIINIKKENLNKYDRLRHNNAINNLTLNIKKNRKELKNIKIKLCQLRLDLQKKSVFQEELESNLRNYKNKRNEIINNLLERLVDQEIDRNPSLDVPSFQYVMKKIDSSQRIQEEKIRWD